MFDLKSFILEEARNRLLVEARQESYSDEHAHAHVWNHLMDTAHVHGWDLDKMHEHMENSLKDKSHPLHFNNISSEGFNKGIKTPGAKNSYHEELRTAVNTAHSLSQHPQIKASIAAGHRAQVTGANSTGEVSSLYKSHGATNATSKTDLMIGGSDGKSGIKISMKKGKGSQLMSGGPEEATATYDHSARQMLNNHPNYKKLPKAQKDTLHKKIMQRMASASKIADSARDANPSSHSDLVNKAQKHIDDIHSDHPELLSYLRKEAATGEGKFGKDSGHAASFFVKTSPNRGESSVKHVDDIDWSKGKVTRVAKPKGKNKTTGRYRSLNFKLDE